MNRSENHQGKIQNMGRTWKEGVMKNGGDGRDRMRIEEAYQETEIPLWTVLNL